MNKSEESTIDWNHLESLPDREFGLLVESATNLLAWSAEDEGVGPISEMPPAAMTRLLQSELASRGIEESGMAAQEIVRRQDAREIGTLLLGRIAQEPELAARVEEVYRERSQLLVVDAGLVAAAALLILVLKLKRIKVGKTVIDLEKLSDGALKSVLTFVGKPTL